MLAGARRADIKHSETEAGGAGMPPDSRQQPAWHVVVLSVLTCMAYPLYWYYKTWRDLQREAAAAEPGAGEAIDQFRDIAPLVRAICMVIPVVNVYFGLSLFKGIAELHPDQSSFPRRHSLGAGGLVMASIIGLIFLAKLPGALYFLSFSACIPLAVVQHWLNCHYRAVEPGDLPVRQAFSVRELIALIVGATVLGLSVTAFLIG